MFGISKKDITKMQIKNINDVIKVTKFYISQKKWEEASKLISQAQKNEKLNLNSSIESTINSSLSAEKKAKKKEYILSIYDKNIESLHNLETYFNSQQAKYKFVPESIKRYSDGIRSARTLILLKEWDQAKKVLKEIKKSEKEGLDKLLNKLDSEGDNVFGEHEKKKQLKIYNKKEKEVTKIQEVVIKKEKKYLDKITAEKFKIRFKKIKSEIHLLTKTGGNVQALNILRAFLQENKDNSSVIRFYNKEKKHILKSIEIQKKKEEEKIQKNIKLEALKLAGKTVKIGDENESENDTKKASKTFIGQVKKKLNIYNTLKKRINRKRLIDEIQLLINENEQVNKDIATKKLANMHQGLTKEIYTDKIYGYNLYGKILGADKISGDTFGIHEGKNKHSFFLGDATGHGIKAGLIVTLISKLFNQFVAKKEIQELAFKINNGLKQDLQSRNFITGILFEIDKENINTVKYVGMGHEPMLVYKKKTNTVERIIPGGLAAGIRMIKEVKNVVVKDINLDDGDIIFSYSDGIVESKNPSGKFYGLDRLQNDFWKAAQFDKGPSKIYSTLLEKLIGFRGGSSFDDDVTIMLLERDSNGDIQNRDSKYIKSIGEKEQLDKKDTKRIVGKSKREIELELKNIKKEKELELIIISLKKLYHIGEFLTLKQEAIRYIKDGWVHKDINFYLKKAIDNETKYKINLKNKKIENRYNVLSQLYKKGDYDTVIKELEDIIAKEGDI